jgi:hypothetical protein
MKCLINVIGRYRQAASAYGRALENHQSVAANVAYRKLTQAYEEIRSCGTEGETALIALLTSENLAVRAWAATHSLSFAPVESERVLAAIAVIPHSLVAFTAEMTLRQWHEGKLRLS